MAQKFNKKLVLEDGSEYYGYSFGADAEKVCEIVFNTAMAGYQELISDPACTYQMVVMTYPLIGNYGVTDEDYESKTPTIGGLVVREYNDIPSNFRYTKTLSEVMEEHHIPGIYGMDTRKLSRTIRDKGTMKAIITDAETPYEEALEKVKTTEIPHDAVQKVSCKKRWYSRTANAKYNVVAIDLGLKSTMVKILNSKGCNVTVVPWDTTAEAIYAMKPDAIFVSSGPGNPKDIMPVVSLVKELIGKYPIMGVDLGNLVIGLAYGADIRKLKFGHNGGNHPVRVLETGKIEISAQGHSFVIDENTIEGTKLEVTHVDILDNTIEGVCCREDKVFAVQFHPEGASGPQDSCYLFDKFIDLIKEGK